MTRAEGGVEENRSGISAADIQPAINSPRILHDVKLTIF
ncbi:MAG: hypothetical protein JWM59_1669 [Verrucomicrobiales bacterium]|nr:hypothetical protein [Verrucomicrobiales bacterium]